jgi:WhiB family redox-sensing transcriptional regulator
VTTTEIAVIDPFNDITEHLLGQERFAKLVPYVQQVVASEGQLQMPPAEAVLSMQQRAIRFVLGPETHDSLRPYSSDQLGVVLGGLALMYIDTRARPKYEATAQLCVQQWEHHLQGHTDMQIAKDFNRKKNTITISRSHMYIAMRKLTASEDITTTPQQSPGKTIGAQTSRQYQEKKTTWRNDAQCLTFDTEVFFPTASDKQGEADAKAICPGCPVKDDCLDWAIFNDVRHGIWGGMTLRERNKELKRRQQRSAQV